MSVRIVKRTLSNKYFSFDAMAIIPSTQEHLTLKKDWAIFTHGYTASKVDCLPWSQRLAEQAIPSVFFDLPGHYMGSFKEVNSFEDFKLHVHECFIEAFQFLEEVASDIFSSSQCNKIIFGGHSLGALLTLKAIELPFFENFEKLALCVGLGISQHKETHLFESSFYQKTLNIRRQLVSPAIDSDNIFPWIKEEKLSLTASDKRIHLITGIDDLVVGVGGMEALESQLKKLNNNVTSTQPKKLPHHEPTLAAGHINAFLKKELSL